MMFFWHMYHQSEQLLRESETDYADKEKEKVWGDDFAVAWVSAISFHLVKTLLYLLIDCIPCFCFTLSCFALIVVT